MICCLIKAGFTSVQCSSWSGMDVCWTMQLSSLPTCLLKMCHPHHRAFPCFKNDHASTHHYSISWSADINNRKNSLTFLVQNDLMFFVQNENNVCFPSILGLLNDECIIGNCNTIPLVQRTLVYKCYIIFVWCYIEVKHWQNWHMFALW